MHCVNVLLLWLDYWLSAVHIVGAGQHCCLSVQPATMLSLSLLFLWFSYAAAAMGNRWVYPILDPSEPANSVVALLNAALLLLCWLCVFCVDSRCLRKRDAHSRKLSLFFSQQPSTLEN